MSINNYINVIMYSSNNEFTKQRYLFTNERVRIVIQTSDIAKVKAYMVLYKNCIVVADDTVVPDKYDDLLVQVVAQDCGCILCIKQYVSAASMVKYNLVDSILPLQYHDFTDLIVALCKKIRIVDSKIEKLKETTPSVTTQTIKTTEPKLNTPRPTILQQTTSQPKPSVEPKSNKFDYITQNKKSVDSISIGASTNRRDISPQNVAKLQNGAYVKHLNNKNFDKVIAIGASTGGPDTLIHVLKDLPGDLKVPVFVVQHMPATFTKLFAGRINAVCDITIVEPEDGDPVLGGCAYIAPGGKQMVIEEYMGNFFIKILPQDKSVVNNPSVDVMFRSCSENFGYKIVAVILTGMGKDGASGLLNIKNVGGYTIGQDEKTSVVYGMPKAAFDIGAVKVQLPVSKIGAEIIKAIKTM